MRPQQHETWHRHGGIRWVHRAGDPEQQVTGGVVLGRGYADQQVRRLGVVEVAAEVIRRELGGPIETVGGVLEASVDVQVDLLHTVVLVAGSADSVRLRLQRLDRLLRSPDDPEGLTGLAAPEVPASRRRHPWAGWSTELAHWVGVGPASLSTEIDGAAPGGNPATRDLSAVTEMLRALHPARGTAAVAVTTEESLIGCAFGTDGPQDVPAPAPLRLRERGPESLRPTFDNNLLTFAAPLSVAGTVAGQVLLDTLHTAVTMGTRSERLTAAALTVDGRRLLAVRAVTEDSYDAAAGHRAVSEAVQALRDVSPLLLERHLAAARDPELQQRQLGLVTLAARNLWTAETWQGATLRAEADALQTEQVRRTLEAVRESLVLGLPTGAVPPEDFPLRSRPLPVQRPTAGPARGRSRHRSLVRLPLRAGELRYQKVDRDGASLTVTTTRTDRARTPVESVALDLSRLAARVDPDAVSSWLIDEEDRRVRLVWPALSRAERLQQVVQTALPPERRLVLDGAESALARAVLGQLRLRRRVLAGLAVFMVLLVGFIITMELTVEQAQEDTVVQVAEGSTVTLGNGTTMTVDQARRDRLDGVPGDVLLVEVEVCGGGPTVDDEAGDDARNYVSPDRFDLGGTARSPVATWPRGTTPLGQITLSEGQCTAGSLGWLVPAATPADLTVSYANRFGDSLTWTVRP